MKPPLPIRQRLSCFVLGCRNPPTWQIQIALACEDHADALETAHRVLRVAVEGVMSERADATRTK